MARSALLRKNLLRNAGADCKPDVVSTMKSLRNWLRRLLPVHIKTRYRGWKLTITSVGVTGKHKVSGEHFIIGRIGSIEQAMGLAKNKVDRLEGPQTWDPNYTNEALTR